MGLFKETKERKLLSHVYAVHETVSGMLRAYVHTEAQTGRKSPACHTVGTRPLLGVRAWVHDARIVGPSYIPHNTWFPAISQSWLWKFERKVRESVLYVSCNGDDDGDNDSDLGGCCGPLGQSSCLQSTGWMLLHAEGHQDLLDLGCETEMQQKWFSLDKRNRSCPICHRAAAFGTLEAVKEIFAE